MAKSTHAQEVSTGTSGSLADEEIANETALPNSFVKLLSERQQIGFIGLGETEAERRETWRGNPSSHSRKNESSDIETPESDPQLLAPETENPSNQDGEELSDTAAFADGVTPETETEFDDVPYSEWTVAELKEALTARGLPTNGNKGQLVARLEEDDASQDAEDEFA